MAEADDTIEWLTAYEGAYVGDAVAPAEDGYESFYQRVGALVSGRGGRRALRRDGRIG
jgi:hypothetical protein